MGIKQLMKNHNCCILAGGALLAGWLNAQAAAVVFHVAPGGSDAWSGKLAAANPQGNDGPLATLEQARLQIRKLNQGGGLPRGGVEVVVHNPLCELAQTFALAAEDSGTPEAPVSYRAATSQAVRISGGRQVANWRKVTEPSILDRLDASARGEVWQADLRALGVTHFGEAGGGGLELFFQDQPMRLARWPNEGFVKIASVLGKTPVDVRGTKGCVEGIFTYEGDRPQRWTGEKEGWLHGYWFWDWADQRQPIQAIDTARKTLELKPPYHNYGYRNRQWFYAFNLLAEIDQPGEWYLDREAGQLYFWPPAPLAQARTAVSVLPTLVTLREVSHVTWHGFIFEAARGTAIQVSGGAGNRFLACTIRNVGDSALSLSGGENHGVAGCDIYQCGSGGISLRGGNRATLAPAGHFADNNHIHHYGRWKPMYSAGINLDGVGCRASHNLIENAPHQAISFGGNDHLMEFNEIHSVCFESNDAGAIYSGRDWTMRGTVIRFNHLHDITGFEGRGCVGVYLDDMFCGTEISGNLFRKVTSAAFIGGGRDCLVSNNIFLDCNPALHVDARALGWAKYHADDWVKEGREKGTLSGTAYNQPPYSVRYPQLVNILAEEPHAPRGNVAARNICLGGRWDGVEPKARPMVQFQDNLINVDPHFVDAARQDYRLRDDSPAFTLGFRPIPIGKIGLYADKNRASWPVEHQVRPVAARRE